MLNQFARAASASRPRLHPLGTDPEPGVAHGSSPFWVWRKKKFLKLSSPQWRMRWEWWCMWQTWQPVGGSGSWSKSRTPGNMADKSAIIDAIFSTQREPVRGCAAERIFGSHDGSVHPHRLAENLRGEDCRGAGIVFQPGVHLFSEPVQAKSGRESDGHNDHAPNVFNLCPIPPPPSGDRRQGMWDERQPIRVLV
jgi:hypothetical protein